MIEYQEKKIARYFIPLPVLIIWITVFVHGRIIFNDFVWDDHYLIVENETIRDIKNIPKFFLHPWAYGVSYKIGELQNRAYYRPLTLVSYTIDYYLFGLNPKFFHLIGLLIHIINSFLIYLILLALFKNNLSSFVGALFFAIHPVNTEALNVISYRTVLFSGLFSFSAFLVHISNISNVKKRILVPLFFIFGLCSKETSAIIPLVLLLYDLLTTPHSYKYYIKYYSPLFIIFVLYLIIRELILSEGLYSSTFFEGLTPSMKILMFFKIFYQYLRLIIFPHPLSPFYDWSVIPPALSIFEYEVVVGMFGLFFLIFFLVFFIKKQPLISLSVSIFFLGLLPVSHIVAFFDAFADRFLYIPLFGLCFAISFFISSMLANKIKIGVLLFLFVLIIPFSILSFIRNGEWKNDRTILSANVRDFPKSFNAHFVLGKLLMQDEPKSAEEHFKSAIKIMPHISAAWAMLAVLYAKEGRYEETKEILLKSPDREITYNIFQNELLKRKIKIETLK